MMEVKAYRSVKKGNLDGYIDVYIPELQWTICGCGVFTNGSKKWVNMPARSSKDEQGKTVYQDIISMPKEMKMKFSAKALEAFEHYTPPQGPEPTEPDFFANYSF